MKRIILLVTVVLLVPQVAWASTFAVGPTVQVSGASPFDATCGLAGQSGTNYPNSEVEPYVEVNPKDGANLIGAWQQDRWSDGGSRGNVVGASLNNGGSWRIISQTKNTQCTGGTAADGGDYQRASDPWVTISPNGHAYLMSLSLNQDPTSVFGSNPDALLVSKSTDGGLTWSDPTTLIRDDNPNRLNDKNSMTADPNDSSYVYAIWDRLVSPPSGNTNPIAGENAIASRGPTLFTRTTNGGTSWEEPRIIFDPGTLQQTIGNQIVVRPQGELINIFNLIQTTRKGATRGFNVTVIRSENNGATWSKPIRFERMVNPGVSDPDDGDPVRTGDIIPDIAVDPNSGQLYAVWQDKRFDEGQQHDSIALSTSTDGGLTWTQAVKVNKTPTDIPTGNQQAFTPAVDVAEDGTVSVTYYDFRNNTNDPDSLPTDYWVVHCHTSTTVDCSQDTQYDGSEVRLTDASFDMEKAPVARGYFVGDYEGLANDIGDEGADFAPFFSQTHADDPASIFFRRVGP
jgi:BNR repeat-like domain